MVKQFDKLSDATTRAASLRANTRSYSYTRSLRTINQSITKNNQMRQAKQQNRILRTRLRRALNNMDKNISRALQQRLFYIGQQWVAKGQQLTNDLNRSMQIMDATQQKLNIQQQKNAKLQQNFVKLQNSVNNLQQDNRRLLNAARTNGQQINTLTHKANSAIAAVNLQKADLQYGYFVLSNQYKQMERALDRQKRQMLQLKQTQYQLKETVARQKLQQLKSSKFYAQSQDALQKRLQSLSIQKQQEIFYIKAQYDSKIASLNGQLKSLKNSFQTSQKHYEQLKVQFSKTKNNLQTVGKVSQSDKQSYSSQIKRLNQQVDKLKGRLQDISATSDAKQEMLQNLRRQHKNQIDQMGQKLGTTVEQGNKLSQRLAQIQAENIFLKSSSLITYQRLRQAQAFFQKQKGVLQSQKVNHQKQIRQKQAKIVKLTNLLSATDNLLSTKDFFLQKSDQKIQQLKKMLGISNNKIIQLKSLLAKRQDQLLAVSRNLQNQNRQMKMRFINLEQQLAGSVEQTNLALAQSLQKLRVMREQKINLQLQVKNLELKLIDANDTIKAIPQAIQQATRQVRNQIQQYYRQISKSKRLKLSNSISQHYVPKPRSLSLVFTPSVNYLPSPGPQPEPQPEPDPNADGQYEDISQKKQQLQAKIIRLAVPDNEPTELLEGQLLQYGKAMICINQDGDLVWIGTRVLKANSFYYTKNSVRMRKAFIYNIIAAYRQLVQLTNPQKIVVKLGSRVAMIRDIYKGKEYISLREYRYYKGILTPTKNGFNLLPHQMGKLVNDLQYYFL